MAMAQPVFGVEIPNPLKIDLISENRMIAVGETFYVGLRLSHPKGYHSYWKHPGIVGVPTQVEWNLPTGFTAGEIEWPAPESVKMAVYDAQGYHGETLLMIPITAPAQLGSENVRLEAKVSWMCCGKACSPASHVPFSITLPVGLKGELDENTHDVFEKYRAKIARSSDAWQAKVKKSQTGFELTFSKKQGPPIKELSDLGEIRFFTEDGQVDSNAKQTVTIDSAGTLTLHLTGSEYGPENPKSLPGVLHASKGWGAPGEPFHIRVDPVE